MSDAHYFGDKLSQWLKSHRVHLIGAIVHPLSHVRTISYIFEESPYNLTLTDTCFSADLCRLEEYVHNAGYDTGVIKRIVIINLHCDYTQVVNKIKRQSGRLDHTWQKSF